MLQGAREAVVETADAQPMDAAAWLQLEGEMDARGGAIETAFSVDGGKSWQPTIAMPKPNSQHGHIAVAADGKTWTLSPQRSPVSVRHDPGRTWQQSVGIADNFRVISDKVNPEQFSAISLPKGKI